MRSFMQPLRADIAGIVSLTLNMTNACLLWLVFCDLPREFHFVCDDVWITENKKYFQNARFLL